MSDEQDGPRRSADGRFWWDGERWQPLAVETNRMPGQTLPTGVIVALVIIATIAAVLFAGYVIVEG